MLKSFLKDESGATAIEYGLIAGLLSIAIISVLGSTGLNLGDRYTAIVTKITAAFAS